MIIGNGIESIGDEAFHWSLETVYYGGTEEQWKDISIGLFNSNLTSATRYYYSETNPFECEGAVTEGNYWHYDTDGVTPVVWTKETTEA